MYSTLVSVALFSALAIQGALADFNVDTPTITACSDVKLTWADTGAASYNVAIVPVDDPCNEVLVDLGDHTMNHITWKNVTLAPNTTVMVSVLDSNDDEGWSGHVTVEAGSDTACLGVSSSSASVAASSTEASSSGTTLIVNAQSATSTHSISAAPSSTDGATAVGAAADGALSGAGSLQISASAFALTALAAVAALAF